MLTSSERTNLETFSLLVGPSWAASDLQISRGGRGPPCQVGRAQQSSSRHSPPSASAVGALQK